MKKRIAFLKSIYAGLVLAMVMIAPSVSWGQATTPTSFDFTTGSSFSFTTYSGTSFPTNISVGYGSSSTGNFTSDLSSDAPNGSGAGSWNAEVANGISYLGASSYRRGSFLFHGNTTGRISINVQWTCRTILDQVNNDFIELQWRNGTSGSWNNVTGVTTSGTYPFASTGTLATSYSVTLPSGAENLSDLRIRWIYYENSTGGSRDRIAIDDITISTSAAPSMSYVSSTTAQSNTSTIAPGSLSQQIIDLQIVTSGSSSPLQASSFTFNTSNTVTTNPADIANAKLWTTGTSNTFATTNQLGTLVPNPNGSFSFSGLSYTLSSGTNYFWLTYDIVASPTFGDVVDAQWNSVTIGTARTPTQQDPSGTRTINLNYCTPSGVVTSYYLSNVSVTGGITAINNTTGASAGGYGDYHSTFSCSAYPGTQVTIALTPNAGSNYYYVWIDWNKDGDFDETGEQVLTNYPGAQSPSYSNPYTIPGTQAAGTYRMRVANSYSGSIISCGPATLGGEYEDYTFTVVPPPTYYLLANSDPTFTSNWGTNTDGSMGSGHPSAMNIAATWNVTQNSNTPLSTWNNTWTLSSAAVINVKASSTFNIAGTLDMSGQQITAAGAGATINVTSAGTIRTSNTAGFSGTATATISSNNTPTITLDNASTVEYYGSSALTVTNGVSYGNLTISGTATETFAGTTIVNGNYAQTGAATVYLNNGATAYNLTVTGNFNLAAGSFYMQNTSTGLGATITVGGAVGTTISGTASLYMDYGGATSSNVSIFQTGNFTASSTSTKIIDFGSCTSVKSNQFRISGSFTQTGTGSSYVGGSVINGGYFFNGTGVQTFSPSATIQTYTSYTVNLGSVLQLQGPLSLATSSNPAAIFTVNGTLDFQTFAVIGGTTNAQFNAISGATIITASTVGIVGTGTTGCIRSFTSVGTTTGSGKVSLPAGVNYTFNAAATTPFPSTIGNPANITINPISGSVTLNNTISASGILTLLTGTFNNTTKNITLLDGASLIRTAGSLTAAPVYGASTGVTVSYNGSADITTAANSTYELTPLSGKVNDVNITFTNASYSLNTSTASVVSVSGNLNITTGKLSLGNNMSVAGNIALSSIVNTGNYTLSLVTAGKSITGASSSAYINGKLQMPFVSGTLTQTFPIGKGGNYRPLTFQYTALTGSSTVTAEQNESALTGSLPSNTNLNNSRTWDISQTGGSAFTYKVTLDATGDVATGTVVMLKKESGAITSNATTTPNYTNSTGFTTLTGTVNFTTGSTCTETAVAGSSQTGSSTCGLTSVTLGATAPTYGSGQWSIVSGIGGSFTGGTGNPSNSNIANPTFSGTAGTAYVLKWTVTNGSCSDNANINVTFNPTGTWLGVNANWTDPSNWCGGLPSSSTNVVIPASTPHDPIVDADINTPATCNTLTINPGATLTIAAGKALTASGATTVNGAFTIESNSSGTGSFIDNGTVTGNVTVQKYLPSGRWWYIGSPVTTISGATAFTTLSTTPNSGTRLLYYDEPNSNSNAYVQMTNTDNLSPTVGYAFREFTLASKTANFTGTLNTGTVSTPSLTRTAGAKTGFNLVSNPYPSAIDWTQLSSSNLETTVQYRVLSGTGYATYNSSGGTYANGGTKYIPAMQAFWVRVTTGTGSLTMTNSARLHSAQSYKLTNTSNVFRMEVARDTMVDETVVGFFPDALDTYENYDSEKMLSDNLDYPQVYTHTSDSVHVIINGQSELLAGVERIIPVGFLTNVAGNFTLTATNLTDFDANTSVYLEDVQLSVLKDMRLNPVYSFSSGIVNNANRFRLHFGYSPSSIANVAEPTSVTIYSYESAVYVNSPNEGKGTIEVYDLLGNLVMCQQMVQGLNKIQLNVVRGIYIVKVQTNSQAVNQKVVIGR